MIALLSHEFKLCKVYKHIHSDKLNYKIITIQC